MITQARAAPAKVSSVAVAGEGVVADAVAGLLSARRVAAWRDLVSGALLVVAAPVAELEQVNLWARRRARPWLPIRGLGADVLVGPLLLPGRGPCHSCLVAELGEHRSPGDGVGAYLAGLDEPVSAVDADTAARAAQAALTLVSRRQPGAYVVAGASPRSGRVSRRPGCLTCQSPPPATALSAPVTALSAPVTALSTPATVSSTSATVLSAPPGLGPEEEALSTIGSALGFFAENGLRVSVTLRDGTMGDPAVHRVRALGSSRAGAPGTPIAGLGTGTSALTATGRALGEFVERYCLTHPVGTQVTAPLARAGVPGPTLDPRRLTPLAPGEYARPGCGLVPYSDDLPLKWVRGRTLPDDEDIWVPGDAVLLDADPEPLPYRLVEPASTGGACSPGRDRAIVRGLLEVIARDALMLTWLYAAIPVRRPVEDGRLRGPLAPLRAFPGDVALFALRGPLPVPVCLALLSARDAYGPFLAAGCAAAASERAAAEAALRQAAGTFCAVRRLAAVRRDRRRPRPLPRRLADHPAYYLHEPNQRHLRFLYDAPPGPPPVPDLPVSGDRELLDHLVGVLGAQGHQVIVCDLGGDATRRHGLHAVKTIVTDTQPLIQEETHRYLGSDRLVRVGELMTGRPVPPSFTYHPAPHPYW
ncbi:thiazole/oxazole-forming peptide maturase, SagD family component [Nonomuraea solani]|uniref:Thiazole/oxazole-forming peptide maturase, SagD family component n=1 Tax=Nonomuraea solani TaxID=1144553 RepID=A0A1H6EU46_9ACTN|nr:YcaO-like family protein [Nonomuraea solani]SEH00214.1 thiazole/oxazole-forming peptide maturase, SagD family component [Nonomuraea solani]